MQTIIKKRWILAVFLCGWGGMIFAQQPARSTASKTGSAPARQSVSKNSQKRSVFTPPASQKQAPYRTAKNQLQQRYYIRPSENPPRFAFAPKDLRNPDRDPSALAIWSTFLTGNISPEIIRWHLRQRTKVQEYQTLARENPEAAQRFRDSQIDSQKSDYEKMLARTHFSLSPNRYSDEPAYGPSNNAILARFLTGRDRGELNRWKEGQIQDQIRQEQAMPLMQEEMIAASPLPESDGWMENQGYRSAARPVPYVEQSLPQNLQQNQTIAQEDRYFNDDFPGAVRTAEATLYGESVTAARPVEWVSRSDSNSPSRMKVYRDRASMGDSAYSAAQPLPASDEGWSPVEWE